MIEAGDGQKITGLVYLSCVPSEDTGIAIATKVSMAAIDRIVFRFGSTFEDPRRTSAVFSPVDTPPGEASGPAPGLFLAAPAGRVTVDVNPIDLKDELEKPSPPGERIYGLFRSARLSASPVEQFMHIYNLILMILGDNQKQVEEFIIRQDPSVRQTQDPRKAVGEKETIYTRLRNEFAHPRVGCDLDTTKSEMVHVLDRLIELTKQAIELKLSPTMPRRS